ncbi:MAG: DNA primase [Bacteroidales bacterium]|nr:DNA primase [Bacteroidales bacterium]
MIDKATVERIIDAAQIVEVVSDFVSLKKRGTNYIGLCPFHNEKTPSFSVSSTKNICKCFSCGKGGNAVNFLMEHEQWSYVEALRYLAKKYQIEIEERELTDEEKLQQTARESMFIINQYAQQYFTNNLFNTDEGLNIGLSYFHERGFRNDIIKKFQLGYSLDQRDAFSQSALKKGYNKEFLLKTSLSMEGQNGFIQDRFRSRVMFPVHSLSGKVVAFGGRVLKKTDKLAKYVNSSESEIYHKSNELYGIFFAKQSIIKQDRCFLVEGYTDVLAMHQAGIENVVASSGTSLTPGQIRMIHRFTPNVTVLYDGDAAGIKASLRGIDLILREGLNVKVVLLPDGDDPDSFSRKQNAESFLNYINAHETDFINFKTSLLIQQSNNDPIKRAEMITDIVRSISIIPDQIVRSVYIRETSRMLEISEEVLIAEINKIKYAADEAEKVKPQPIQEQVTNAQDVPAEKTDEPVKQRITLFDRFERSIIYYVVRYGEKNIWGEPKEGEEPHEFLSVIDFISQDLDNDDIIFNHPLYKKILSEAVLASKKSNFKSEHYFLSYPDIEISKLATDIAADKYTLSKIHTKFASVETDIDRLHELVPRAIYELKDAIVRNDIKILNEEIKNISKSGDFSKIEQVMEELKDKNEIRSALAKELGERIITRL